MTATSFGTATTPPLDLLADFRAWAVPKPPPADGKPQRRRRHFGPDGRLTAAPVDVGPAVTDGTDLADYSDPGDYSDGIGRRPGRDGAGATRVSWALIFDTETTVDAAQQLNFGAYRLVFRHWDGRTYVLEEGLFYSDNLPERDPEGYRALVDYVAAHPDADVTPGGVRIGSGRHMCRPLLNLTSRRDWVEGVLWRALDLGAVIVGFNLPFDLSRIAVGAGPGTGEHYGAFSLKVWELEGYRPRFIIRNLDSRKSLISAGSLTRNPSKSYNPRFLDLRTLTAAITDRGFSLESACKHWEVEHGKTKPAGHGTITDDYVAYCRRDVQASAELLDKVLVDFESYRIPRLGADRALSGASLAKATLKGLGVVPPMVRNSEFPVEILGASMESFYGGRSEVRTRRVHAPAQAHDFTSMYPTVNTLTGLWGLLTADTITADDATDDVRDLLDRVTVEDCYRPETWREFVGVAQILADRDTLPVRAAFAPGMSPVIGLQQVHSDRPTWYTIADLVASKILTGRVPTIIRAVRFVGHGTADTLTPSQLGTLTVDPAEGDLFRSVIELRKSSADPSTQSFLKLFANSGSYGIFSEFVAKPHAETDRRVIDVTTGADSFESSQTTTEEPGAWCFPPIAATITGSARLMLALLERAVVDAGGWWVFCDTDSMAVIVDDAGSLIPCPGGPNRDVSGRECVRALTHAQTAAIRERFDTMLNPYDRRIVPHLLKHEYSGTVYAVSAKRYATYRLDDNGKVAHVVGTDGKVIDLGKQHGVGYLLSPDIDRDDPDVPFDTTDRGWIDALWRTVVERDLGITGTDSPVTGWDRMAAVARLSVTSPHMLDQVKPLNEGKSWPDQVKPFNFLTMVTVDQLGESPGALVAPYNSDTRNIEGREFLALRDGSTHRVRFVMTDQDAEWTEELEHYIASKVPIRDMGKVVYTHDRSLERKYLAADGGPCVEDTRGILLRVPVRMRWHRFIGKEVHTLDESEHIAVGNEVIGYGGDGEWEQTLAALREAGVKAIREELDRTGSGHKYLDRDVIDWPMPPLDPFSDEYRAWQKVRPGSRDFGKLRRLISEATDPKLRKRRTERLAEWEADRETEHRKEDTVEPRITDGQLRRILNGATTRPGLNVRNRLTRFVKEREARAERATIDAAHAG